MADSSIKVSVIGDVSDFKKKMDEAGRSSQSMADKLGGVGTAMTLGVTAPIVAGAGLAVKAAAEEEQQMGKLADAIRQQVPGATEEMIAANEDWITSLQNSTGTADSSIREMEQAYIAAGASMEDAQKLTALAFDVAARTGKDAASVQGAFVKGINGSTGALAKLGVQTKDASGEAKSFEEIQADLAATMGGAAAASVDNAAGRAEIMKLKMADLTEQIGAILIPILDKLVGVLTSITDAFSNLSPGAQKVIVAVLGVVAAIGPLLMIVPKVLGAFKAISAGFQALRVVMMANPWILIIVATIALVTLIVANWDKIVAFLKKTWDWIKKTAKAVWDWIKSVFKAALDAIVRFFMNWTLIGVIAKNWDKIKEGVKAVKDFIINTWNAVVSFFRGLPQKISNAVGNMWDGIKTAFRNAINWIIKKWNNLKISIGGGTILGVKIPKITVETPNIPTFAGGGIFRAPTPGGAGLAVLHDRERVTPAGRGGPAAAGVNIIINAGMGSDPTAIAKAVLEALQRYQRLNGPLPLDVRLN